MVEGIGGKPLKFKSVEELQKKIDNYFEMCDREERPYTVTGLCLALDCDRKTLINYGRKEKYFHTVKHAKLRIENYLEEHLVGESGNKTGIIFNLKNNYEWKDKQENINVETNYEDYLKRVESENEY